MTEATGKLAGGTAAHAQRRPEPVVPVRPVDPDAGAPQEAHGRPLPQRPPALPPSPAPPAPSMAGLALVAAPAVFAMQQFVQAPADLEPPPPDAAVRRAGIAAYRWWGTAANVVGPGDDTGILT